MKLRDCLVYHLMMMALLVAFNACGAEITDYGGSYIRLNGEIKRSDVEKIERWLSSIESQSRFRPDFLVDLDSAGGDWDAAMQIGRLLRKENATAIVSENQKCFSACVLLLAGATTRFAYSRSRIGIHRPYRETTEGVSFEKALTLYRQMETSTRTYLREMNMPDSLFDAMVATPPESMRLLSTAEITLYRLEGKDPALEDKEDTDATLGLGLSKGEYLVRKDRVRRLCNPLLPRDAERSGPSRLERTKQYFACQRRILASEPPNTEQVDQRLSSVAAQILSGQRVEYSWPLFHRQYFPGVYSNDAMEVMAAWSRRHGVLVAPELRTVHGSQVIWLVLQARAPK